VYAPQYAPGKSNIDSIRSGGSELFPQAGKVRGPVPWHEIGSGQPREFLTGQLNVADAGLRFARFSPRMLHLHPHLLRYGIASTIAEQNRIVQMGQTVHQEPIDVTTDRAILDGHPQWKVAVDAGRDQILCILHSLTAEQQLEWLLRRHRRRNGWNKYCRILTALELEEKFKKQALENQIAGGQKKGLSNLAKAEEMHVRSKLAELADVCETYIDNVKRLRKEADTNILRALESGEISICWALGLLRFSQSEQIKVLEIRRAAKVVRQAYPRPVKRTFLLNPGQLGDVWQQFQTDDPTQILCSVKPIGNKKVELRIQVDEALLTKIQSQGELDL
jgi:hypothetical protein